MSCDWESGKRTICNATAPTLPSYTQQPNCRLLADLDAFRLEDGWRRRPLPEHGLHRYWSGSQNALHSHLQSYYSLGGASTGSFALASGVRTTPRLWRASDLAEVGQGTRVARRGESSSGRHKVGGY